MTSNDFYVRKLTLKDMPRIKEISSGIWEGHDYIPFVVENWISRDDYFVYGIIGKASKELLAFANIRWLSRDGNKIAWMEGGRVDSTAQKKGFGTELLIFALKYAEENGATAAMYDTSSRNLGSVAIGKNYNFKMKFCMHHVFIELKTFDIEQFPTPSQALVREIDVSEVIGICENIKDGPIEEFSKGWSYVPFTLENLANIKGKWMTNEESIMLVLSDEEEEDSLQEAPENKEIWLIIYGKTDFAIDLLSNFLHNQDLKQYKSLEVFCHPEIGPSLNKLGFKYSNKEGLENKPAGVLLFEKLF